MRIKFSWKPFVVLAMVLIVHFSWAQNARKPDVIRLRDDRKLEVIIQEMDDKQVRYKKVSDPEGPVFTVQKSEIQSILYGNGEEETFEAVLEVPNYYSPSKTQPQAQPAGPVTTQAAPRSGNKFYEQMKSSTPEDLRAMYKFYRGKSKGGLALGIAGTSAGIIVAAIGTGMVASSIDANGYYKSYQDELRARRGAWMMLGGFAGAVTCGTVGFIKAGKNGSKASKIRRELLQRGEPLTFQLSPGYYAGGNYGFVSLKIGF